MNINHTKIVTCYLNGAVDPQRGSRFTPSIKEAQPLIDSAVKYGDLVIITDCIFDKEGNNVELIQVEPKTLNPYYRRWQLYKDYIDNLTEDTIIFFVDATDVEVLRDPFDLMLANTLYVGWENDLIGNNKWLRDHHKELPELFERYSSGRMYNAGVIGGEIKVLKRFLDEMQKYLYRSGFTDMAAFNYVLYHNIFNIVSGETVTTEFKKFDYNNRIARFRHK